MSDEDKKKFWEKVKKQPFVPIGILGTLGMIGYGIYDYKNHPKTSLSVYVMHYRVKAQSMIVGAMLIGVSYSIFQSLTKKKEKKEELTT